MPGRFRFTSEQRDRQTVLTDVTKIVDELSLITTYFDELFSIIRHDSVHIPHGTTVIGKNAFKNCTGTMYIFIPRSVAHVEEGAFNAEMCRKTVRFTFSHAGDDVILLKALMCRKTVRFTFSHAGDDVILLKAFLSDDTDAVEIPAFVTIIADNAFYGCKHLKTVTMYNGITEIGARAFLDCRNLQSIVIPPSVTKIAAGAFRNCRGLQSIVIPDGVTKIGGHAFEDCLGLKSIIIPDGVTKIEEYAFALCRSLQSIEIPDSVTEIAAGAFLCCDIQSIVIPPSVTKIGYTAFRNCESLESIEIPDGVTKIEEYAFEGCRSLQSIEIPDSVTEIAAGAFVGCHNLQSIVIPPSVTKIGHSAFRNCESLESIEIPDGVTYIGASAFQDCAMLQSIVIPDSVTEIAASAFEGCRNLQFIVIPPSVTKIGYSAFRYCESLESIVIPPSVTKIGESAFQDCAMLQSIVIPDSVEMVGNNAFKTHGLYTPDPVRMSCLVVPDALSNNSFGLKPEIPVYKSSEIGPLLDPNRRIADIKIELESAMMTSHPRIKIEHVWELRTPILKRIFAAYTHSVKSFARSYINLAVTCKQINLYFDNILRFCFHQLPQDLLSEFGITLPNNDDFEHPGIDEYHYTGKQYFFDLVLKNQRPPLMLRRPGPQIAELCRHHDNTTGYLNADNQPTGSAVAEPPQKRVRLSPT